MTEILSHLRKAAPVIPAIFMTVGTAPMLLDSNAPDHVKYGGSCLLVIAAMLGDMQSGRKVGYSDKIVKAVRKIPGMERADEGTVLGTLTVAACAFLGGGAVMNMAENGVTSPDAIKLGVNTVSYPMSAAFDFQRSRLWLENLLGKEIIFKYTDAVGRERETKPVSTVRLLQQLALISGAFGIGSYGTQLDDAGIQFTGAMFGIANGISVWDMTKEQIREMRAKIPLNSEASATTQIDIKDVAKAIEPVVAELNINPEKGKGR